MPDNSDVFLWLDQKKGEYEMRVVYVLACRELAAMGWSYRRIGDALGVSYEWVRRALMSHTS